MRGNRVTLAILNAPAGAPGRWLLWFPIKTQRDNFASRQLRVSAKLDSCLSSLGKPFIHFFLLVSRPIARLDDNRVGRVRAQPLARSSRHRRLFRIFLARFHVRLITPLVSFFELNNQKQSSIRKKVSGYCISANFIESSSSVHHTLVNKPSLCPDDARKKHDLA